MFCLYERRCRADSVISTRQLSQPNAVYLALGNIHDQHLCIDLSFTLNLLGIGFLSYLEKCFGDIGRLWHEFIDGA
jgi:hypothetical protein